MANKLQKKTHLIFIVHKNKYQHFTSNKRKSHSRNKKEDKVCHNSFTVCPNKSNDNCRSPLVNGPLLKWMTWLKHKN